MNWFREIPKVELHLHLEGAIPLVTLWQIIQKYGGDPSVPDVEALARRFEYRDFPSFLETWSWKNLFLREYEDFSLIAEAAAQDLKDQNVRYAEVFFSPSDFFQHGLATQQMVEAIRGGLSKVPEVKVALVADLVRDTGPERAASTLAEVSEVRDLGVIGIGIGGSEHKFPPELFESVYEEARRLGFHTTAHAGEAAGAESVWGAIRSLQVDRIGHGTRAQEDESLLHYLAEKEIPLEMCPMSNVCTGVVERLDEHPVRRYFERGIIVTINTDDPKMFGTSLANEYDLLEKECGFSREDLYTLILSAIRSSWLTQEGKRQLTEDFRSDRVWVSSGDSPSYTLSSSF